MRWRIALVLPSDDLTRSTWSGIPYGLARGLSAAGADVVTVGLSVSRVVRLLVNGPTRLLAPPAARAHRSWPQAIARGAAAGRRIDALGRVDGVLGMVTERFELPARLEMATFDDMTLALARQSAGSPLGQGAFPAASVRCWTTRQAVACQRARCCFAASPWAARSLIGDYGVPAERVCVVGLGRNIDPLPVVRPSAGPRFLFVGRDWERKGGDDVLRAFAALRERRPEARLDVVGGHPRLDVPGVTGHGVFSLSSAADRGRLQALYANATCFVLPSHFEPFGIAYLEAAAAGLPLVATTQGGGAEALSSGCRTVAPGDAPALLAAMDALSDPVVASRLGAAARRAAARFTWETVARRVLDGLGLRAEEPSTPASRRPRHVPAGARLG